MKKQFFTLLLSVLVSSLVSAQSKIQFSVTDIRLFTITNYAGNIAVDENGNQLTPGFTIQMFMYVSIKGKEIPTWNKATYNGKQYDITVTPYKSCEIEVGKKKDTDSTIKIKAKTGFNLWKIELTENITSHIDYSKTQTIKLSGEWKKNKVNYTINRKATELQAEMHP